MASESALIDAEARRLAEQELGNLLAIIHRDGGHHTEAVGFRQSVADAHQVWAELQKAANASAAALTAAREAERERWAKKLDAEVARIRGLFREYKSTEISDAIVSHLDSWARRLRENDEEPAE